MPKSQSPAFAVGVATPWTWKGSNSTIGFQIRFYADSKGEDELAQGGGRTVSITVSEPWRYPSTDTTVPSHSSTIENAPPTLIPGGQWTTLDLGLGEQQVTFAAVQATEPADGLFYRVLVKS